MINRRKFRKLVSAPEKFFLDSRFFYFRKFGQVLVNVKKGRGQAGLMKSINQGTVLIPEGGGKKNSGVNEEGVIAELFVSDALEEGFVNVLEKMCKLANVKLEVGPFDLPVKDGIFCILMSDDGIAKIKIEKDAFFEVDGSLFLRKGMGGLFKFDFSPVSNGVSSAAEFLKVAFWKLADDNKSLFDFYRENPRADALSVVNYGLKGGVYSEDIVARSVNILCTRKSLTDGQINFIFSKLYRVCGPSSFTEKAVNAVLREKKRLSASTLMKLASFLCEAGDYTRCVDVAKIARSASKSAWEDNRYIGLSNFLFHERMTNEAWAEQDAFYFDLLRKNQNILPDLIGGNDFRVVGNSPCDIGKRRGLKIDSSDLVVRFNSAVVDYPHSLDYGSKTDVLVLNPRYYETKRNTKDNLKLIVVSDGSLYATRNLAYRLHDLHGQAQICLVPDRVDRLLVHALGASPSSGMKILYWLYLCFGPIDRSRLCGFSMVDQNDGVSLNYQSQEKRVLPIIHDWIAERKLLDNISGVSV